ncbi:pyruvate kinase [Leptospira ilyithenensis]|uniref:Pyruvate kinase n=1 Tax=Leptospira ilyithenensis TaxID=2484901 RepID=A0A4R9LM16_9LEPT|nr:pyruvate kinase [Leptospira ilyithenensis]TGN07040.1 pyruvate kinase [Leptospira ilyithenensis]
MPIERKLPLKRTKIICTIGPASANKETILDLIYSGMDMARMNFSHATHEYHKEIYELLRECEQEAGTPIGILADLQGPKIRTGKLSGPIELKTGDIISINNHGDFIGNKDEIGCTYQYILNDIEVGHRLLVDDGKLSFVVKSKTKEKAVLETVIGGILKDNKGINLPGTPISAPALSEKDIEDLQFALSLGVDYIALSFVRRASDLEFARQFMKDSFAGLIAKLERPEAIQNIEEIIDICDGVMIARGDLGVELDSQYVPIIQKETITKMNQKGKPVITATQMLETMIDNPRPTRAEASDVANAVMDGTDAVMLSGETASGKYPVEAVATMTRIIQAAEDSHIHLIHLRQMDRSLIEVERTALGNAAESIARSINAKAIINFTRSGYSSLLSSEFRPIKPIYSFTPFLGTSRKMKLYWGVEPYVMPMMDKFPDMIAFMSKTLKQEGKLASGDTVVILSGAPGSVAQTVDFIQIHKIK